MERTGRWLEFDEGSDFKSPMDFARARFMPSQVADANLMGRTNSSAWVQRR